MSDNDFDDAKMSRGRGRGALVSRGADKVWEHPGEHRVCGPVGCMPCARLRGEFVAVHGHQALVDEVRRAGGLPVMARRKRKETP